MTTARAARNAATSLSTLHAPRGSKRSLEGVVVLAVDDDDDARELLLTLLEQRHATVFVASNARDAFALFKAGQPHVIVSDIAMPNEDGYALIRRIRALSESNGGRTPAIAVTAYAGTSHRALALDAGFDLHVPKPVDLDALVEAILSLYDARESPPRSHF
ncbi:MAG: response regulator [Polyangiaceae bacterium]|nr:response regulator [Polyangiaceae bacterium]